MQANKAIKPAKAGFIDAVIRGQAVAHRRFAFRLLNL